MTDRAGGQYFCFFQHHMITMGVRDGDGLVWYRLIICSIAQSEFLSAVSPAQGRWRARRALARLASKTNL